MTLTIDISPEAEAQLQSEAANRGLKADEYAREAFQVWLRLAAQEPETDEAAFSRYAGIVVANA